MTELTLEELAKCTESLDTIERFTPGYEETGDALIHLQTSEVRRLLAMARELIRIRSAAEFLQVSDRRVCLVVDYRAPDEATYQIRAWAIPQVAASLGWTDPPASPVAELKGGEG
jgi:hypothetical protein